MHPAFLHKPEGRKFVACIFGMDLSLVSDLTAVIKNQVRSGCSAAPCVLQHGTLCVAPTLPTAPARGAASPAWGLTLVRDSWS